MADCPDEPGWRRNPGHRPHNAKGKRVRVILSNGDRCKDTGGTTDPPGWAADTTNWALPAGYPYAVEWYKVL